jgi:hypothetical protein
MFTKMTDKDAYGGDFESYIQFLKINVEKCDNLNKYVVLSAVNKLQSILFAHEQQNKKYSDTVQQVKLLPNKKMTTPTKKTKKQPAFKRTNELAAKKIKKISAQQQKRATKQTTTPPKKKKQNSCGC